jgi:hypothetical protein
MLATVAGAKMQAGHSGFFRGEFKRTCRAFIANMNRASLKAIREPSQIACFNKSPSAAGLEGGGAESVLPAVSSCASLRANGAVSTGRQVTLENGVEQAWRAPVVTRSLVIFIPQRFPEP